MARLYKVEAIVLKRINFGEADKLVTLYTPYLGKLFALAKGAQRFKSKRSPYLEPLCYSSMLLAEGRDLDMVREVETIDVFLSLRENMERMGYALYVAELIDRFTPTEQENRALFRLLLEVLQYLGEGQNLPSILRYFELRLLQHTGYRPQLQRCVNCNAKLTPIQNFFSPKEGGILCSKCHTGQAFPISTNALKVLRLLQRSNLAGASRLKLNTNVSQEIEKVMQQYIDYLLEGKLKTRDFLDKVARETV